MTDSKMNRARAERNLRNWLRTSKLPREFPIFEGPPENYGRIYPRRDGAEYEDMFNDIVGGTNTLFSFQPGQGATTCLDAVIEIAKKARLKVHNVLIKVVPSDFDEMEMLSDLLISIRREVARSLLFEDWEVHFYDDKLVALFKLLNVTDLNNFRDLQIKVESADGNEETSKLLLEALGHYAGKEADLLFYLYDKLGLSTLLLFDFATDLDEDFAGEMVHSIKSFHERMIQRIDLVESEDFHNQSRMSAAIMEAFFASKKHVTFIQNSWARDYRKIQVPSYSMQDIWYVLEARFENDSLERRQPLATIFSEDFISRVYSDSKPFCTMMKEIREEMLLALDIDETRMPHKLIPEPRES